MFELDRVNVNCPYCHKKIGTQPVSVLSIFDPRFKHKDCADERGRGATRVYLEIENTPRQAKLRKNEVEVTIKRKRKGRSDAGKPRGKYKSRKGK